MQKQMAPSPEVRAALSEKLAQPAKKRPVPWMKYGAAACVVLMIGALGVSRYPSWDLILQNFRPSILETRLHSYVTVESAAGYVTENAIQAGSGGSEAYSSSVIDRGGDAYAGAVLDRDQLLNTGDLPNRDYNANDLPGGAYVGDLPVQEEAVAAYEKLMDRFNGQYPDWYGGAYIDNTGTLIVQLVEDKDPADKTLELQVLDWTDNGRVGFSSCKYSLRYLRGLQEQVVDAMQELGLFSGCGADEELNRLDLTLTSVTDEALITLAQLDPDDDAIYVQVGRRANAGTEDPAVHHAIPGGATVPDDEGLIAFEPYYDGAHYDLEHLPEELPENKRFAVEVQPGPVEDAPASGYDPDAQ